jgi:hypothetical protein
MIQYLNDRTRREGLANLVSVLAAPDDPHLPMPVDLAFICDTYHHINNRVDYFTRLKEQLAPEVVESEMKSAGFDIAERHDFLPEQYLLVFVVASRD